MAINNPYNLTPYRATMLCEGAEETDDEALMRAAWQYLVDTGLAWQLQGTFGRQAARLIEAGVIHRALTRTTETPFAP